MRLYSLGCETSRGLAISMGDEHRYEDYWYLYPDPQLKTPDKNARIAAAAKWQRKRIFAFQDEHSAAEAYIQDATGPGFSLPGCELCVSENARTRLGPVLGDQVCFLPIEIVGAPMPYWVMYATRYYNRIDVRRSRFKTPSTAILDRRDELREPAFTQSPELEELFLFRVSGSSNFTPFALGDFATQKFLDLVVAEKLGGFSFVLTSHPESSPALSEPPMLVSEGPHYRPLWTKGNS